MTQNISLNNTVEEELRIMLVEKNNECNFGISGVRCAGSELAAAYSIYWDVLPKINIDIIIIIHHHHLHPSSS